MLGCLQVQVQQGKQEAHLSSLVIDGKGRSPFGRDWQAQFQLDWHTIHRLHNNALQKILESHQELLRDKLCILRGYKDKIFVDGQCEASLLQSSYGAILYASIGGEAYSMRSLAEELERPVQEGIYQPVQFTSQAAPLFQCSKVTKEIVVTSS